MAPACTGTCRCRATTTPTAASAAQRASLSIHFCTRPARVLGAAHHCRTRPICNRTQGITAVPLPQQPWRRPPPYNRPTCQLRYATPAAKGFQRHCRRDVRGCLNKTSHYRGPAPGQPLTLPPVAFCFFLTHIMGRASLQLGSVHSPHSVGTPKPVFQWPLGKPPP